MISHTISPEELEKIENAISNSHEQIEYMRDMLTAEKSKKCAYTTKSSLEMLEDAGNIIKTIKHSVIVT